MAPKQGPQVGGEDPIVISSGSESDLPVEEQMPDTPQLSPGHDARHPDSDGEPFSTWWPRYLANTTHQLRQEQRQLQQGAPNPQAHPQQQGVPNQQPQQQQQQQGPPAQTRDRSRSPAAAGDRPGPGARLGQGAMAGARLIAQGLGQGRGARVGPTGLKKITNGEAKQVNVLEPTGETDKLRIAHQAGRAAAQSTYVDKHMLGTGFSVVLSSLPP